MRALIAIVLLVATVAAASIVTGYPANRRAVFTACWHDAVRSTTVSDDRTRLMWTCMRSSDYAMHLSAPGCNQGNTLETATFVSECYLPTSAGRLLADWWTSLIAVNKPL